MTSRYFVAGTFLSAALVLTPRHVHTQFIPLTAAEVNTALRAAAEAVGHPSLAVSIVDRSGRVLGLYSRTSTLTGIPDTAVTVARAGAFFSNDQAPLSSRTVRFISGIHFPPGVRNTSNAALYGIENTNRGCQLDVLDLPPAGLERPRGLAGSDLPGSPVLPCRPDDTRGCARGGPIAVNGLANNQVGITTGKADVLDTGEPLNVPVNPGGIPIFRDGRVVGAVGVAGVSPELAEYAATLATLASPGLGPVPVDPIPFPGAVFIDGLRLPFFGTCLDVECVRQSLSQPPQGAGGGSFLAGNLIVVPRDGMDVPSGYLIGPRAGTNLPIQDVTSLIDQAVAAASRTRAQIRLPIGQTTRMVIAVSDRTGDIVAAFRMPDATVFSFDVAVTKARNAFYFSSAEGYAVLRAYAQAAGYAWDPLPPSGSGWALTNRTLSFGGQPLFPPGIDLESSIPGPWFEMFKYDSLNPCTEGPGPSRGQNRAYLNQSGIVWFPGSAPVYRNGVLVGGIGVSGDGVEQDDYVTGLATTGFGPPEGLRVDQSYLTSPTGELIRVPYLKFPRNPEIP